MINVGICDDEEIIRKETIRICLEYGKQNQLTMSFIEFSSGEELVTYNSNIDILFLDVELKGMSGIEVLKSIENCEKIGFVVFMTGYNKYVWDSFSRKTLGYLIKPVKYSKFTQCLNKVLNEMALSLSIDITYENTTIPIKSRYLQYIEAKGSYSLLVTNEKSYLVRSTLKEWDDMLIAYDFIRIHKSYIVNLIYIKEINKEVILDSGAVLKASRSILPRLKETLRVYRRRMAR
jgi:DNA-binding LytR/AlgR family response regulator